MMDLTAEQFSQLIISAAAGTISDGDCSRRQPRAELDADASIIPLTSNANTGSATIEVSDVSRSGIGFLYGQRMSLDEEFALILPQENDTPAILLCAVAFWEPLPGGVFAIGARFVRVLRDANTPLPIEVQQDAPEETAELVGLRRKAS